MPLSNQNVVEPLNPRTALFPIRMEPSPTALPNAIGVHGQRAGGNQNNRLLISPFKPGCSILVRFKEPVLTFGANCQLALRGVICPLKPLKQFIDTNLKNIVRRHNL